MLWPIIYEKWGKTKEIILPKRKEGAYRMNPCTGCEYRQIFLREDDEGKILFCRKFKCERDDARSLCERWEGFVDPVV